MNQKQNFLKSECQRKRKVSNKSHKSIKAKRDEKKNLKDKDDEMSKRKEIEVENMEKYLCEIDQSTNTMQSQKKEFNLQYCPLVGLQYNFNKLKTR